MKKYKPDTICPKLLNCGNCWWFNYSCLYYKSRRMKVNALSKSCEYIVPLKSCMDCIVCNGHKYGFK